MKRRLKWEVTFCSFTTFNDHHAFGSIVSSRLALRPLAPLVLLMLRRGESTGPTRAPVLLMLRRGAGEGTEPMWAPVLLSECDEYRDEAAPEPAAVWDLRGGPGTLIALRFIVFLS